MGIKGLTKLIADKAPDAIREGEIGNYFSENPTPVHCCVTRAHRVEGNSVPLEIDTACKLNGHIQRRQCACVQQGAFCACATCAVHKDHEIDIDDVQVHVLS